MRIQKSLILDFDEQSARESAEQDWKIDLDREVQERKQNKAKGDLGNDLEHISEDEENNEDDAESDSEGFDEEDEKFMNPEEKQRFHARRERKQMARIKK